ncbi:MAG TPA: hypothetical protein VNO50_17310 [Pyrinomonadaceae bacterium]|nr:hypothetical protein [Pyrinomonadaceae bacterium]
MRNKLIVFLLMVSYLVSAVSVSQGEELKKKQYVVVPPEHILLVIASQPDCPLKIENARLLAGTNGGGAGIYQVRNQGTKAIQAVTLATWSSVDTGSTTSWPRKLTNEVVMPGGLVPFDEEGPLEIVPLTQELREKLKFGTMLGVAILMVVKVTFTDGSTYDAEPTFKALRSHLRQLNGD